MQHMNSRLIWWLAALGVLLLAVVLRCTQLGQVPTGLYWDEVAMLVDAKSVAETGRDMHGRVWYQVMYPSYGDYKLPVYIWLASLTVKVFGVSAWALRIPSAIAGILTVVATGWCASLAWSITEKKRSAAWAGTIGLATMAVVAVSPWSVMFSRTAFEGHVGQLLLTLSVIVQLLSLRWRWLRFVSPMIGALATYTYFSVRFVWPVVFLV